MVFVIYDARSVPEFLVRFYEFDILTSYIMKMSSISTTKSCCISCCWTLIC
ncbi:MAG: hypothetical protein ACKPKO_34210 [Candidatus Fonsibacter sp.]